MRTIDPWPNRGRLVVGLINPADFAHAAVTARAVGALASCRAGPVAPACQADRSRAGVETLSVAPPGKDRALVGTLYEDAGPPDDPCGPLRTDRPNQSAYQ